MSGCRTNAQLSLTQAFCIQEDCSADEFWINVIFLSHPGTLQLRYNLGGLREPFSIDIDQRNLANGQPHTVNISRVERDIEVQVGNM